jgi:hypothetical protein
MPLRGVLIHLRELPAPQELGSYLGVIRAELTSLDFVGRGVARRCLPDGDAFVWKSFVHDLLSKVVKKARREHVADGHSFDQRARKPAPRAPWRARGATAPFARRRSCGAPAWRATEHELSRRIEPQDDDRLGDVSDLATRRVVGGIRRPKDPGHQGLITANLPRRWRPRLFFGSSRACSRRLANPGMPSRSATRLRNLPAAVREQGSSGV